MATVSAFQIRDGGGDAGRSDCDTDTIGGGEVEIKVRWSSVNYKDALAGTGRGKILKRFPLIGGVDMAGSVINSTDSRFHTGQSVLVTGYGLSQDHDGGYSPYARVPADWVVALPAGMSERTAMLIGTAGFTAGLSLLRMRQVGQQPDMGPILITGATGGVASIGMLLLSRAGYETVALTRKGNRGDWLKSLGCAHVLHPSEIVDGQRPLESARWGGALDSVGGDTLAWLTRTVKPWGSIASFGLAGGHQLGTTVMPFILRGVNLLGINSADCPMHYRQQVWQLLAEHLNESNLEPVHAETVALEGLMPIFERMLAGEVWGRTLVRVS